MPFEVATLDLRGRVVRLGPVVDEILERHAYPAPVAKLLGEAVVLTVMLGSALKIEGRFILQTQSDGPVRMLVVDFTAPGKVRACARFDKDRVAAAIAAGKADGGALLGKGHLAMTIDQGADMSRYQGLVALEGGSLEDAAHEYFHRSEQIPTRVRLAVAEELRAGEGGASIAGAPAASCCSSCPSRPSARASPISIRAMRRKAPRRTRSRKTRPGSKAAPWSSTVEDVELIDPALSSERLVYRLFHEPGVRVFRGERRARRVLVLARQRRSHAQELLAGRPRPHGRERQDFRHLRILQRDLRVRARRGRGEGLTRSVITGPREARVPVIPFMKVLPA